MTSSVRYRQDINGLRAWAVSAVVLFQFGVPGFSGGFVGVDVFFVISGYLMTSIIVGKIVSGDSEKTISGFDFLGFYLARARRILPALIVMCLVLILVGWFYLSPDDYKTLGNHTLRALVFISNLRFLRESGYFDADSHEKILLHTWSLSVEWQFYIFFPIVLAVVWKILPRRQVFGGVVILLFITSLLYSQYLSNSNSSAAFYLLSSRAWEMLAGSLVFLYGRKVVLTGRFISVAEISGLLLILASVVFYTDAIAWPGINALLPVVGTVLILLAMNQASFLTTNAIAQWLGRVSYSLYLWHWPVAFAIFYMGFQSSYLAISLGILISLFLAYMSWRFVENSAQTYMYRYSYLRQFLILFSSIVFVGVLAYVIKDNDGVYGRFDQKTNLLFDEVYNKNPRLDECHVELDERVPECVYGGDVLGLIVIGDSHAQSIIRSAQQSLPSPKSHVLDWTLSWCATMFELKSTVLGEKFKCSDFLSYAYEKSKKLDANVPLLIVNRISVHIEGYTEPNRQDQNLKPFSYFEVPFSERGSFFYKRMEDGIVNTACSFANHRPVYMLRPIPEMKSKVPMVMGVASITGQSKRVFITVEDYYNRHRVALRAQDRAAAECGIKILDPLPYLCSDGRCWGDVDGLPIYYDDDHLSERGGQLLIPLFKQIFEKNTFIKN